MGMINHFSDEYVLKGEENMTWDEEKKEILSGFSTEELTKELNKRNNDFWKTDVEPELEKLSPVAQYAEFVCPKCDSEFQIDVDDFDDNLENDSCCENCGEPFMFDLEGE